MSNKRGRHAKRGGRTTPKGTRPLHLVRNDWELPPTPPARPAQAEPDLDKLVREALASDGPLDLLALVSSVLWALRSTAKLRPPEAPAAIELVEAWCDVEDRVTTGLLAATAVLADEPAMRAAAAAEVARRDLRQPDWIGGLADASVGRAVEVSHALGDGDLFLVEVTLPGARNLTIDVYVDHNLGTIVKNAFVVSEALEPFLRRMHDLVTEPHTTLTELDLADARAKISDALGNPLSDSMFRQEGDAWPQCRPIVEWALRMLPPGGTGYPLHEWTERQQHELATAFFASPYGRAMRDCFREDLLDHVLDLVNGGGTDLMRWSPSTAEILVLDQLPHGDWISSEDVKALPDLLRGFIGYCHNERGIPADLTETTLRSVDGYVPSLMQLGRTLDGWDYEPKSDEEMLRNDLIRDVGSEAILQSLDAVPLPDEPFDWQAVPVDTHDQVRPIVDIVDATCEALFDVELRTAARRLTARVAVRDPVVLGRGRADTAAAALVWIVASANESFGRAGVLVKDLMAHLGLASGNPSQRADTFLRAAGIDTHRYPRLALGDPTLLTSARRRSIIERRDQYDAALADGTGLVF